MAMDVFFIHPIILMVWVGLGYSIIAATVWSVLPFIIPEKLLGTGFGMMTSIQNLGMAVAPQIVGLLQVMYSSHLLCPLLADQIFGHELGVQLADHDLHWMCRNCHGHYYFPYRR